MNVIRLALGQINLTVGDIAANTQRILDGIQQAQQQQADLIVFPELSICGYPPEDILLRPSLQPLVERALQKIQASAKNISVLVGHPRWHQGKLYNSASVFSETQLVASYDKHRLPNYSVFDEQRYFQSGENCVCFQLNNIRFAISICEDIWSPAVMAAAKQAGAQCMLNLNASPYHLGKNSEREAAVAARIGESPMPVVYVNLHGGQDELVFDGSSFVMDEQQHVVARFPAFVEQVETVELCFQESGSRWSDCQVVAHPQKLEGAYQALVLGVQDFVRKNGFEQVVLGLSGGIDSALTALIAVDALGAENVVAVMLPTRYTSSMSLEDAQQLAKNLNINYRVIVIESVFEAFNHLLADEFVGYESDTTEENIQARCRGLILMAISNKKHCMVLTTGNKSEMAVGYSTLYGDMAGGFDVLKDVPKTLVYELSRYCNRNQVIIPQRIIDRPPSAELREDQTDQDSLPDYEILDGVLEAYVEQDKPFDEIVAMGYEASVVARIIQMVDRNEYKRRQAPPGIRITPKAFGKDRRYPIVSGFHDKQII
ncbi:MAG: NAD+ synthase [Gammaproteobacteria bacterium]|nr:NAD+ synthase [Gammaproteobacteria bacterium]